MVSQPPTPMAYVGDVEEIAHAPSGVCHLPYLSSSIVERWYFGRKARRDWGRGGLRGVVSSRAHNAKLPWIGAAV